MNRDEQLYVEFNTLTGTPTAKYNVLARAYGFQVDSVRGRVSKGNTPRANLALAKHRSEQGRNTYQGKIDGLKEQLPTVEGNYISLFLTDLHVPNTHWPTVEIALQIVNDLPFKLAYVSGLSDLFDMKSYSHWDDPLSPHEYAWYSDIENSLEVSAPVYQAFKHVNKGVHIPTIWGNHDLWYINWLRVHAKGAQYKLLYDMLATLRDQGVTITHLPEGKGQNVELISNQTAWTHGWYASENLASVAKKTIEGVSKALRTRNMYDVVTGHVHRWGINQHASARHYSTPCATTLNPLWSRYPVGHQHGFSITYTREGYQDQTDVIVLNDDNSVFYNGKEYTA